MSVSPREKKIMIVLGIIFFITIYMTFVFLPQFKNIGVVRDELKKVDNQLQNYSLIEATIKAMYSQFDILQKKLNAIRENYPPMIYPEDMVLVLKNAINKSGLNVETMQFSELTQVTAGNNEDQKNNENKNEEPKAVSFDAKLKQIIKNTGIPDPGEKEEAIVGDKIKNGSAYALTATLSFKANYEQIKSFMNEIEAMKVRAEVVQINFNQSGWPILSVNCSVRFLGIMDRQAKVKRGQLIEFDQMQKVPNPADINKKDDTAIILDELKKSITEEKNFDITAVADPVNVMSTQTVGVTFMQVGGEAYKNIRPSVSASNKGTETVSMYFEEREGGVYFRAKTSTEEFPDKDPLKLAELLLDGDDIKMLVASTPRKGNLDTNLTEFNITNKTSKKILVKVSSDDKTNPRVRFKGSMDSIVVANVD